MKAMIALAGGFVLDMIFGDPHFLVHPVQIIGWFIDKLKKGMQHLIFGTSYEEAVKEGRKRKPVAEWIAGWVLMIVIVGGTYGVTRAPSLAGSGDRDPLYLSDSGHQKSENRVHEGLRKTQGR